MAQLKTNKRSGASFLRAVNRMIDSTIAKMQRGLFFLLLLVFPLEPSHFKWHIHALEPFVHLKLSFYLSDLIILFIFFLFFFRSKKEWISSFWTCPSRWLLLFYAMGVVSLILSEFPFDHRESFRLLIFFTKILLFSSLVFLLREGGEKFLHRIFYLVASIAVIESIVALYCYYIQSSLDLLHFRWIPVSEMTNPCSMHVPSGFRWLGDRVLGWKRAPEVILRSYGTFNHPNILGGYFVFALLASYLLFFMQKGDGCKEVLPAAFFYKCLH